jgi:CDP-6-deoxy-D-xylo-4-hexulose-3-dehydrase
MIKLIKSTFYKERETKKQLIDFISSTDILSMGEQCKAFEKAFAKKQQRKYAVFVSSGSAANLILIQALLNQGKIAKGDKIGVSALTWATNIMPIIQLGLVPIPIDCEVNTLNISAKTLHPKIGEIKALFITNALGFSGDLFEIKQLCLEHDVLLLEDNCESLGSKLKDTLLGNFGLAATFSFFVGHHLSTIEGGMLVTDDEELYYSLIMCRAHGWDRNLPMGKQSQIRKGYDVDDFYSKYFFYDLAYNVRPTEISGFLGNVAINYWDEIVGKRQQNYLQVLEAVRANPELIPVENSDQSIISNFSVPIICKNKALFKKYLAIFEKFAETRPIIAGNMTEQPFYKKYFLTDGAFANAKFVHENGFYIGNNPELTDDEVDLITKTIKNG